MTTQVFSLNDFLKQAWKNKLALAGFITGFSAIALAIALWLPNVYRSEALLLPTESQQNSGLGALASQFGGLASMAGLGALGDGADKSEQALEILKSRQFFARVMDKEDMRPALLAEPRWQPHSDQLDFDDSLYDASSSEWVRDVSWPQQTIPTLQESHKEFLEVLRINKDLNSGFVRIGIDHVSPIVAQRWVQLLVSELNDYLKLRDIKEANKSIAFLNEQIEKTNVAEVRSVLFQMVEEHYKTLVLAEARDEYVFRVVDAPVVSERKVKPMRAVICIAGSLIGLFIGLIWMALFRMPSKEQS
ncbi:Wzz/FepE/Etk N-terminal domain-containing protein [Paraferrimonas sedimenticola]|uniref:Wzz/FepE/Etk N-terminal domain-containing protein n=1 Tax=Paraferrimonas sedimenticola TaxID=375674 RepID=UPI0014727A0B|nr:Wzz/FepE/Etk N-terminal domain-containing protein [Paraferrimonas sedimenticola]